MTNYEITGLENNPLCTLVRSTDGACIPIDPLNSDYIQYLMDVKKNGISIASCAQCGDGIPNEIEVGLDALNEILQEIPLAEVMEEVDDDKTCTDDEKDKK